MIRLIVLLALLSSISNAGSIADLDSKYGFRDLKFEARIDSIPGFVINEDEGDQKFYSKSGDDLKIGEAELKSISYGAYKGKLSHVLIVTSGYLNSNRLLDILKEAYGRAYQGNKYIERYSWFGKRVSMSYEYDEVQQEATVIMSSKPLREIISADEKQSAKKAASGL